MKEEYEKIIMMPNEIFSDIKEWCSDGRIKSVHHSEFVYCYYWYLAYLWRYAVYGEVIVDQKLIKSNLGYNPNEKRIDYIMKKEGLLDKEKYTEPTRNFPTHWNLNREGLYFTMLDDFNEESKSTLLREYRENRILKEPIKHTGTEDEEGIFYNSPNTHAVSYDVFKACMSNEDLGCSGFYMYGILTYINSLSRHFNEEPDFFSCSNETLMNMTGWKIKKVIKTTDHLVEESLIDKEQRIRMKGNVNQYGII